MTSSPISWITGSHSSIKVPLRTCICRAQNHIIYSSFWWGLSMLREHPLFFHLCGQPPTDLFGPQLKLLFLLYQLLLMRLLVMLLHSEKRSELSQAAVLLCIENINMSILRLDQNMQLNLTFANKQNCQCYYMGSNFTLKPTYCHLIGQLSMSSNSAFPPACFFVSWLSLSPAFSFSVHHFFHVSHSCILSVLGSASLSCCLTCTQHIFIHMEVLLPWLTLLAGHWVFIS